MRRTIYLLFFVIISSGLTVSCGSSGGDDAAVNNTPVSTDCVLGTSKIGECTI